MPAPGETSGEHPYKSTSAQALNNIDEQFIDIDAEVPDHSRRPSCKGSAAPVVQCVTSKRPPWPISLLVRSIG